MKRRGLLTIVICVGLARGAYGQDLPIKQYSAADGLPHNTVVRIVKDSRGFLWFCTNEGLSRFDGTGFANFGVPDGLPAARINDFLETRAGDYWVATEQGLVRFNPRGSPLFIAVPFDEKQVRDDAIRVVRERRDGSVWVGGEHGVYRVDASASVLRHVDVGLPSALPGRTVNELLEDLGGSLWIGTPAGLYRLWPDGFVARYTAAEGLPGEDVFDLMQSRDGRIWAGTRLHGFFRFSADQTRRPPQVDLHFTYPEIDTSWVYQLHETSTGRLWVATARGLLDFADQAWVEGRKFSTYGARHGVRHHDVTALAEDAGGNLWFSVGTVGAGKLSRDGLISFGERDGLQQVNAIFEDGTGRLCYRGMVLGEYGANVSAMEGAPIRLVSIDQPGLVSRMGCFDGRRFNSFWPRAIPINAWVAGWVKERVTLHGRNGEWWVAAGDGVYRFPASARFGALESARPLARYSVAEGMARPQAFRIFEDSTGHVWISTTKDGTSGLARWSPSDGALRDLSGSPGVPDVSISLAIAFVEDRAGQIWIGFDGQLTRLRDGRFRTLGAVDGVPPGKIRDLHVDRTGRLWFASSVSGLVRVEDAGSDRPRFVATTTREGLSTNELEIIVEDEAGHLYTGGGNGIDRVDPSTGHITHYTTADGLAPGLLRAGFRDRRGVLWFGTSTGLSRLVPSTLERRPPSEPPVFVNGVRLAGVSQRVSAIGETDTSLPDLEPNQRDLQIDFVGLEFGSGRSLRYQFQLAGADAGWSPPSAERTVTYAKLGPGQYLFQVRAVASDGSVSARPAAVAFTVLRPVWQRWWFILAVGMVAGMMARQVHRTRLRRVLEVADLRTRIASDLHDDIGSNLTRIALLSDIPNPASPESRDAAIGRIARESVSAMGDIVWAIKPERESLIDLTRRLRLHADELFADRGVALRFNAPDSGDHIKLGVDVRRDVLLFFKEVVTNASRHSRCTSVSIDLRLDDSALVLVVADDGVGFDPSIEREGQGLRSLKRRADRLGGSLEIVSSPGTGTVVSLRVPR